MILGEPGPHAAPAGSVQEGGESVHSWAEGANYTCTEKCTHKVRRVITGNTGPCVRSGSHAKHRLVPHARITRPACAEL